MLCFRVAVFLLASKLAGVGAECVAGFQSPGQNQTNHAIIPPEPKTWEQMDEICSKDFGGQSVIGLHTLLTDEIKKICGEALVPVDIYKVLEDVLLIEDEVPSESEWDLMDRSYQEINEGVGALHLPSGKWHLVSNDSEFTCAVCKMNLSDDISDVSWKYEEFYIAVSIPYQITLVSREAHLANISVDELERLHEDIIHVLESPITLNKSIELAFRKAFINRDNHLEVIFHYTLNDATMSRMDMNAFEEFMMSTHEVQKFSSLKNFYMQIDFIRDCPKEVTIGPDGDHIIWPSSPPGTVQRSLQESTELFIRRECDYNETEFRHLWSAPTFYEIVWTSCSLEQQFANEIRYQEYLSTELISKHQSAVQRLATSPIDATILESLGTIANNEIYKNDYSTGNVMVREIEMILMRLPLGQNLDSFILSKWLVQFLVTDLNGTLPRDRVSFAYEYNPQCLNLCPLEPINVTFTSSSDKIPQGEKFSIQLSDRLTSVSSRLALVVIWKSFHLSSRSVSDKPATPRFPIINIALALNPDQQQRIELDADEYYTEIAYEPLLKRNTAVGMSVTYECAAWNNQLNDWTFNGCGKLKAVRGTHIVCRCRGKYFLQEGSMLTAKFALLEQSPYTPYLLSAIKNHTGLAVSMAFEVILSGLGILSIILTALLFKKWRDNPGHKILLHMVMALTSNLVIGFAAGLMHFDTEGVGCLVLGVFRHYSFLAMFLWMLVLSGLQMKRLTTVAGAKATTHLILKVALFAWGIPLIPITILLAWNTRFYRSDRFDRGYCYPEGFVFELTVQAPAGIILIVNLGIFMNILRHIFDCTGEKKITKHTKSGRAEMLNRLKTSFFIFFLFGFTWVFHFLSEERVIVSDFLFEYLFLMTATFHLWMLALFFIILQKNTRKLWLAIIPCKKTKVLVRRDAVKRKPRI